MNDRRQRVQLSSPRQLSQLLVVTPENKVIVVPKDDVETEKPDKSAMPEDAVKKLSKKELRDLVEFLNGLKEPMK